MDAELLTLASAGASTLVTLMVKDGWAEAKEKFAALLGRRHGNAPVVAGELESARAELAGATQRGDAEATADVAAEWRARLRRMLLEDPETASLLTELVQQYASQVPQPATSTEIHGNTFQGPVAMHTGSGDQTNTFGASSS